NPLSHQCIKSPTENKPPSRYKLIAADVFGDGRDRLLTLDSQDSHIYECDPILLLQGHFCNVQWYIVGANGAAWIPVRGDFDGDGRADLLMVGVSDYRACAGSKPNSICTTIGTSINWRDTVAIIPGDFNGDSKTDLILVTQSGLQFCAGPGLMA